MVDESNNNNYQKPQFTIFDVELLELKDKQEIEQAGIRDRVKQIQQWLVKEKKVDVDKIQSQMVDFITKIQSVLSNCPIQKQGYIMETVEVNAQISAEGQIGFMGTHVGMTGTAGITFVFKKI